MTNSVDIFCKKSIGHLTLEHLYRELDSADLMTMAEDLNLPGGEEAAIDATRPHLRVKPVPGHPSMAEVHYHPNHAQADIRPIQLVRVQDQDLVKTVIQETLENLPEADGMGPTRVREHLSQCVEIVWIEMTDEPDDLGALLVEVLAYYIAEQGDGLVWFYNYDWASPEDRVNILWTNRIFGSPLNRPVDE